jgi:hypothetical protein
MTTLATFRQQLADEFGLANDSSLEQGNIDAAVNDAVQKVLEDTHCYIKETIFSGFDGSSADYTMDSTILEIVDLYLTSQGTNYKLERLTFQDLIERRRIASPSGSPSMYYAVQGANLFSFHPAPGSSDTLTVYHVPVPTALSGSADDPSSTSLGGIPTFLHRGIFYWAASILGSYDDDQSSQQGQRYLALYAQEITRYKKMLRRRGGNRNARAVPNDVKRRRTFHTNDIYPNR